MEKDVKGLCHILMVLVRDNGDFGPEVFTRENGEVGRDEDVGLPEYCHCRFKRGERLLGRCVGPYQRHDDCRREG